AAQVGHSSGPDGDTLLGVFAAHLSSSSASSNSKPQAETSDASALCLFSLDQLDRSIDSTRDLCYTQDGRVEGGSQVAYIEYEVKSSCANLPTNTLKAYPCGSDHTPSPMASRIPLEAEAVLDSTAARLTAVAVHVREGHSIAFLGDSKGNLLKVFLGWDGQVMTYASSPVQPNAPIHRDLLLDQRGAHIYIMTSYTVEKRPVAECGDHLDCSSCLSAKDPYCGWCVLDGRCGLREDCQRGSLGGHWLWSFDPAQQCLAIQELNVYNVSRGDQTPIGVSVLGLPALGKEEVYSCFFQDTEAPARLSLTGVTCSTPDADILPLIGQGDDSVMVTLSLRFVNVTVAETQFTFYNCSLVQQLSGRRPCQGCVGSRWGCNWCIHQHLCTPKQTCGQGVTIYNKKVNSPTDPAVEATTTHPSSDGSSSPSFGPSSPAATEAPAAWLSRGGTESGGTEGARHGVAGGSAESVGADDHRPEPPYDLRPYDPQTTSPSGASGRGQSHATDPALEEALDPEEPSPDVSVMDEAKGPMDPALSSAGRSGAWGSEQTLSIDHEARPDYAALYQSDASHSAGLLECPCVEKVQSSPLLPVNVESKITLLGQHLHLFQDEDLDYECVLDVERRSVVVEASVEAHPTEPTVFLITCQLHQYAYAALEEESRAVINIRRRNSFVIDSAEDLHDCSRCGTAAPRYDCVWCGADSASSCVFGASCSGEVTHTCPAPVIHTIDPASGPVEGGTVVTISGSNLGQRPEDVQDSVSVAGVPCHIIHSRYQVSSRIVCETTGSGEETSGQAMVSVRGGGHGQSSQVFSFQDPVVTSLSPLRGPKAGGSRLSLGGRRLRTGHAAEVSVSIGGVPCLVLSIQDDQINCQSGGSNRTGDHGITVRFGGAERHLQGMTYHYTPNPNITRASPSKSFLRGGRTIQVSGHNLDVVQEPKLRHESMCAVISSSAIRCVTPAVGPGARRARVRVHFLLDSLQFEFSTVSGGGEAFSYQPDPLLFPLNRKDRGKPYHHKPGSIISVEGVNLDLAISKEEVVALIGDGVCTVKTLTRHHLYCEPPAQQPPRPVRRGDEGLKHLPEFTVQMGSLNFSLGRVQYDSQAQISFPPEARVGVGVGATVVALMVLIIVLIY
ncbi:hypothetical protein NHX12_009596, partial [Muraenolepis orangiensis]